MNIALKHVLISGRIKKSCEKNANEKIKQMSFIQLARNVKMLKPAVRLLLFALSAVTASITAHLHTADLTAFSE